MSGLQRFAVTYAERATGIVCDMHGVPSQKPSCIPRTCFDELAVARAHCRKVTTGMPALECWIELPTGEKIGPITADQRSRGGEPDRDGVPDRVRFLVGLLRDILRQYWANLLAIGVFVCAAVKYCRLHDAFDLNLHLKLICYAFGGLVMFIASDNWSDLTGHYGMTRQDWLATPAWFLRGVGIVMLVACTIALYHV